MRTSPKLRFLVGVRPHREAYTAGLFLSTAVLLDDESFAGVIPELVALLADLRISSVGAWGYGFPVTTRAASYEPTEPNSIATAFAALGLVDALEAGHAAPGAEKMLSEAVDWLCSSLWEEEWSAFRYHTGNDHLIYNASILCALVVARAANLVGAGGLDLATRAVQRVIDAQAADGSWAYGAGTGLNWVDNHHSAFILKALLLLPPEIRSDGWRDSVLRGLQFFDERLIARDGAPLARNDRRYPQDSLAAGQAIETLALAASVLGDDRFEQRARTVLAWTQLHLLRGDGRYRFRQGRRFSWPGAYLRWGEAHVALGAARLAALHR
jgi:hypothetical protein